MKLLSLVGVILLSLNTMAQSTDELSTFLPGFVVKAKIERKFGKVFEPGAIICAQDLSKPENKYDYGYTFKVTQGLEILEYPITKDTVGPADVIASREQSPNAQAAALELKADQTVVSQTEIKFSGASLDFQMKGNTIALVPVAMVSGTLSLKTNKLDLHVVGTFAQDLVLDCQKME